MHFEQRLYCLLWLLLGLIFCFKTACITHHGSHDAEDFQDIFDMILNNGCVFPLIFFQFRWLIWLIDWFSNNKEWRVNYNVFYQVCAVLFCSWVYKLRGKRIKFSTQWKQLLKVVITKLFLVNYFETWEYFRPLMSTFKSLGLVWILNKKSYNVFWLRLFNF